MNKRTINLILINLLLIPCIETSATIFKSCIVSRTSKNISNIKVIPIRSKTIFIDETKGYYPQRSILGSMNHKYDKEAYKYPLVEMEKLVYVYGDRKVNIKKW